MDIEIERVSGIYQDNILFPIWKESLPDLDEKRIHWGYEGNPCGKAQLWLLKNAATGEYFGCSALLPRYFFINGKKRLCAIIADTAVKKKYRALGPALKLHKEIMQGSQDFALILAFPNKMVEPVLKMAGFKKLTDLVTNTKVLKSEVVIEKKIGSPLLAKLLLPFALIADLGLKMFDVRAGRGRIYGSSHAEGFDERFDQILEDAQNKFNFINERNSNYLNWRFKNCPYKDYSIFVVNEPDSSNLVGYIIYYVDDGRVDVEDFLWIEESVKLEDLLSIFIKAMRKRSIRAVSFTLIENKAIQEIFKRIGFFEKKTQTTYYFSSEESLSEIMTNLRQKAFVTLGDEDI